MLDIELSAPARLHALSEAAGLGVIVRRQGVVQAFAMGEINHGETVVSLLDRLLVGMSETLLEAAVRQQLVPASKPPSQRTLTVVICTKDRPDLLSRCLNSVFAVRSSWVEVLVVDNASTTPATRDAVTACGNARYVFEPRPGLDFARNRALAESTSDWIAYIDDDVVVDRGYFDGITAAWADHPNAAAVTGLVLPFELETEAQIIFERNGGFGRGFTPHRYGLALTGNNYYPCGSGIFGAGCNMVFSREALLSLGGFDEALDTGATLPGGGDLDIFYRVLRASHALIYDPRLIVFHQHRRELEKLRRQYWSWGLGFMAFVVKSYRTDKEMQKKFRGLVYWWLRYQVRNLAKASLGRGKMPLSFVVAEIVGGVQGLFGEYDRSRRRTRELGGHLA
jgi:glycosyltransferase involved in cell wall biosynthesis